MSERVDLRWMKIQRYAEWTGHTADAVHALRKKGHWRDGYHCKVVEGNLWVSYTRAQEWIDTWDAENRMALKPQPDAALSAARTRRAGKRLASISRIEAPR